MLEPGVGDWRAPGFQAFMFAVAEEDAALPRPGLRVTFDGDPPIRLQTSWTVDVDRILYIVLDLQQQLGERLVEADTLRLDLLGSNDRVLATYSWDTHRLDEALETLAVVEWRCTTS